MGTKEWEYLNHCHFFILIEMSKNSGFGYMQAPSSESTHIFLWFNALCENEIYLSPCDTIDCGKFLSTIEAQGVDDIKK